MFNKTGSHKIVAQITNAHTHALMQTNVKQPGTRGTNRNGVCDLMNKMVLGIVCYYEVQTL